MSLKRRLTWAFVGVAFTALLLASVGLNFGMHRYAGRMRGQMMGRGPMVAQDATYAAVTFRWSILSSVAALAVATAAGIWSAKRITRPLTELSAAVQQLGMRDLSRRVLVDGNDEIAELAGAFNRMGERLDAEERSRRQLLADTAHELRHPLAVMKGRLELMQEGKVPIDQEALLPLQDEVIRLTRLVGDLRDLSLADVGGLSLNRSTISLTELVVGLISDLDPVAESKEIMLSGDMPNDLPPICADPDRMRQVFLNLIANALQYTPEGGRVIVSAWLDPGKVSVRICDTGMGIDPEQLPRIFDRFYRTDKSRTRATGGSGLGLAIVRSLVELHQGNVTAQSELGKGTCLTVTLPCAETTQARQLAALATDSSENATRTGSSS